MKQLILLFSFVFFLISCKDKKKNDPEPEPSAGAISKQVSVKINGTDFSCASCGNTYASGGMSGVNFSEGGSNRFLFSITGFLKPGTYNMVPFGNPSFTYEKDGRYFRGRGSLTITETDTSSNGALKKFIGTFNCVTDTNTNNGVFYKFTEGVLNINFK
ncbi:hypothetical protein CNR22_07615 [Sphingobacteriaceae bacterium]|nr:hypothetical protein CNR22_07615 [Sphingobacteriaceae bacterium]